MEYEESKALIECHFGELASVRCTKESVAQLVQIFEQVKMGTTILEGIEGLHISAYRDEISSKLSNFVDSQHKTFLHLLHDSKLCSAYDILSEMKSIYMSAHGLEEFKVIEVFSGM